MPTTPLCYIRLSVTMCFLKVKALHTYSNAASPATTNPPKLHMFIASCLDAAPVKTAGPTAEVVVTPATGLVGGGRAGTVVVLDWTPMPGGGGATTTDGAGAAGAEEPYGHEPGAPLGEVVFAEGGRGS